MTKAKILREIEDEARAYAEKSGYDPDNQATLELAHEMICLLDTSGSVEDAFDSCLNSYRDALMEAEAEIMEKIN